MVFLTCKCCPIARTTWTEASRFSQCTPTGSWEIGQGAGLLLEPYCQCTSAGQEYELPVHNLHNGICPTWHVPWEQVRVGKLPMHKSSIQSCLFCTHTHTHKHNVWVHSIGYFFHVMFKTHLVLETIGRGLVVLGKVWQAILCLVCTVNHCAHCVSGCSCMRTPEVVHATFESHLQV